jgi:hypothetical protein
LFHKSDDSDDDSLVSQVLTKQERNTKSKRQEKATPAIKRAKMEVKAKAEKAREDRENDMDVNAVGHTMFPVYPYSH